MNIPQWCIDYLLIELVKELSCPSLPMSCVDPREWAWNVKNTDIQLTFLKILFESIVMSVLGGFPHENAR